MGAYAIARNPSKAEWCMAEMDLRDLKPGVLHFNMLIKARASQEDSDQAEAKFEKLLSSGLTPDEGTFGVIIDMIDMYAQMAKPEEAKNKTSAKTHGFRPTTPQG